MRQPRRFLVVTGSVRPNSTNRTIVDQVVSQLRTYDQVDISVANLAEMKLPFFDATAPPSSPSYKIPHDAVRQWGEMVMRSDAVILVMPEYNRAMTAVQKNAIDWLYHEWSAKPIGIVAYGFHQGRRAVANFESINGNIGARLVEPVAHLQYGWGLATDGSIVDSRYVMTEISRTLDAVMTVLGDS